MLDLVPTVFDLGKVKTRYPNNGKSWVPLLHPQSTDDIVHKDYVVSEGGFLKTEEPIIEVAPFPYDIKANLQHDEIDTVGRVVSMRTKEFTFIYRLYEPNELYNRIEDLEERHNLIADPTYTSIVDAFEKKMLKFFIESSDHAPFVTDTRIPEVNLPLPGSKQFK
ncbi:choline-sulfatase conserved domain [Kluyveromyces marxianus DMKU3-1042]|uniref:Chol_sulfatase n=1 Tax=Kluyveromyces marxianus (strain DMKU3-1042 / BCC 29191 / NBRC 104275) TaxID=1003335 RepID=W0T6S0_KLUMD|nr:choline-sulfatase [Kluyveromyces marxianus DMKU3-1042]XP_022676477.1 cd304875 domain-containing protein [Kluyveromyces marxianus DMKU3-1042]BAO39297.1 chol_sulfatase [Kluyveromyces marxianus DMKU3-1042]BAO40656.1 choline-sulfatase conserved domain [Kluyveromyces marxianus DMKU3-1042]